MVEKGEKRARLDKPGTETIDPERGAGESRGLGGLRLHTPRGMVRERKTPATSGRIGRRPRVVPSFYDAKPRHGKVARKYPSLLGKYTFIKALFPLNKRN